MAIKFAREEMQRSPGDTASPEVQAAIATIKIHYGMQQVKNMPKDKINIQGVRKLVQYRQTILKYLKRKNPERIIIRYAKLGLTDDVIVRESTWVNSTCKISRSGVTRFWLRKPIVLLRKTRKLKILKIEWPSITNWQRRIMRLCTVLSRVVNIYKSCTYIIILHY